jgi:hypothetical protein
MLFWPKSGSCCCGDECGTITIVVRRCTTGAVIVGATVTVEDSDDVTVGSGTTDSTGTYVVTIPAAGTYTITATSGSLPPGTVEFTVPCAASGIVIDLGRILTVQINGCNTMPLAGATVTATLADAAYTAVSDSAGVAKVAVGGRATYTVTATHPSGRFTPPASTTATFAAGATDCAVARTMTFAAATGYRCVDWCVGCLPVMFPGMKCVYPYAETLFMSDSVYGGTVTLDFFPKTSPFNEDRWEGTRTLSVPASDVCPAVTLDVIYLITRVQAPVGGHANLLGIQTNANGFDPGGGVCSGGADISAYNRENAEALTSGDLVCPPAPVVTLHGHVFTRGVYRATAPTFVVTE